AQGSAPDFTIGDLDRLSAVASKAALALGRMRRAKREAEQRRMARGLELARQIQRRLLPTLPPVVAGFPEAAEYRPAFGIGGDFYDVIPSGSAEVTALIGDVAGKGVAAALVMSRISSEFRRLVATASDLPAVFTQLNDSMCERSPDDTFVTAAGL